MTVESSAAGLRSHPWWRVVAFVSVLCALAQPPCRWDARALGTKPEDWEVDANGTDARPSFDDKPLVIVAGLSRTGTSSLQEALIAMNMTVHHTYETIFNHLDFWYYYLNGEVKAPNVRAVIEPHQVDALSDCWFAHLTPEIIRAYPNAKVILTSRDADPWLRSYNSYIDNSDLYHWSRQVHRLVLSRISQLLRLGPLFKTLGLVRDGHGLDLDKLPLLMNVWQRIDKVVYGTTTPNPLWRGAYERHYAYVRSLVPKDQLLEFSFGRGDGWREILDFLGVEQPKDLANQPFPRLNCVASKSCMSHLSKQATTAHERYTVVAVLVLVALALACRARLQGKGRFFCNWANSGKHR